MDSNRVGGGKSRLEQRMLSSNEVYIKPHAIHLLWLIINCRPYGAAKIEVGRSRRCIDAGETYTAP